MPVDGSAVGTLFFVFITPYQGGNRSRTRSLTTSPSTRDPSCDACRMDRLGGIGIHRCSEIVPYYHSLILLQSYTGVDSTLCAPFVYHLGCVGLCGDIIHSSALSRRYGAY